MLFFQDSTDLVPRQPTTHDGQPDGHAVRPEGDTAQRPDDRQLRPDDRQLRSGADRAMRPGSDQILRSTDHQLPSDADQATSPRPRRPGTRGRLGLLPRRGPSAWSWTQLPSGRPEPSEQPPGDDSSGVPGQWSGTMAPGADDSDVMYGEPFREISDGMAIAPSVTVVLPVMNEAANLPYVFESLPAWIDEVVLVDGRSTDDTIEVARRLRPDIKVVLQGGAGKGDALVAGFAASTGDIIVTIDGDGSTDGREIVRFVGTLLTGADFAKGSRFSSSGRSDDITIIRRYGNKMLNITVNAMFGASFSDLCYGYNAFWARHLDALNLDCPGFEVETLMSIRAARAGLRIQEVPSHERLRLHGSSNLSAVKDGLRILRLIMREKRAAQRSAGHRPKPFLAPGHLIHGGAQRAKGRPTPRQRTLGQRTLSQRMQGQRTPGQRTPGQRTPGQRMPGSITLGDISLGRLGRARPRADRRPVASRLPVEEG